MRAWVVWRDVAGIGAMLLAHSGHTLPVVAEATGRPTP